jgi:Ferritin-like
MLYMKPELFALLDTNKIGDLRKVIQSAIEIEHSTMPPYLYALYSLGSTNAPIYTTLRTIVLEEMLHMLLACNLLNAVGGTPKIHDPRFVPNYPTPLPGTVHGGLTVPLAPFSKTLAKDVFMEIEEPELPLNFPVLPLDALGPPARTIGQFYGRIKASLQAIGPGAFTGDPARQVTTPLFPMPEPDQRVTDLGSAIAAIDYIVKQGEGTSESPNFAPGTLAHYYQFAEIVNGRKLIPNPHATPATPPAERYIYGGAPIVLQPGILPLLENPRSTNYAVGSDARQASDDFNRTYTRILGMLDTAFDGTTADLSTAIDTMKYDLTPAAQQLTQIVLGNGLHAGPTFEYLL